MVKKKIAFLFPGQGSQFVGMGKDFFDNISESKEMFQQAGKTIGRDLPGICFNGPEETLNLTENTQPAILVHSIIALKTLIGRGIESVMAAGHSLGEYSALVAAGALDFLDAVHLVHLRGKFMQEAVPVGVGAMAAIVGLPLQQVEEICRRHSSQGALVHPANMNSPEQTVIAGHRPSVERAVADADASGAKKTVLLPVSAPFHCSLMKPAELNLQKELERTEFRDPVYPIITNVDAKPIQYGSQAREALVRQVCSPVRWSETMQRLVDSGIEIIVEIGPGRVLSGLMRRYNKNIRCHQVSDRESLEETAAALNGGA